MQVSDDLFLGPAYVPSVDPAGAVNPSPMPNGVGPLGRVYVFDVVPVTSGTALLAALQTTAAAGNLVLTAGAGVTTFLDPTGVTRYVLDTPRRVTLTSAANLSAINFTVYGYDLYNQPMTQTIAGPNANTVATTKTFKSITRVAASAAVGSTVSVGFNDALGLPYRVTDVAYVLSVKWNSTLAQDAGTFVAADTTSPATASTGDTRGVYTPSNAANGARRLIMALAMPAIAVGPQATRIGAIGVPQV